MASDVGAPECRLQRAMISAVGGVMLLLGQAAHAQSAAADPVLPARHVPDGFVFAAVGDLLGPYGEVPDLASPGLAKVATVLHGAAAAFANEEGNAFDLRTFRGFTGAENGGGYPLHSLPALRAIRGLGITLLSNANNHAGDWGIDGMRATQATEDAIDFTHAGSGESLEAARAPGYRDTAMGRVALVASASTFTGSGPASGPNRGAGPRPGISPLHVAPAHLVGAPELAMLRAIAARGQGDDVGTNGPANEARIDGALFRLGDAPGLSFDVSKPDREALVAAVAVARRNADVVAFSIHAHETGSGGADDLAPADFEQPLFHDVIDAGADLVMRHGPHSVMGIELYHGKPIFYGLGSLFFDLPKTLTLAGDGPNKQVLTIPSDWYEGAIAVTRFERGVVREIILHPLMLEQKDGPGRGLPRPAEGGDAKRILERIREGSRRFGTPFEIRGDVGIMRSSSQPPGPARESPTTDARCRAGCVGPPVSVALQRSRCGGGAAAGTRGGPAADRRTQRSADALLRQPRVGS